MFPFTTYASLFDAELPAGRGNDPSHREASRIDC